jgi:GNAT superfamily N-acetyltransferase
LGDAKPLSEEARQNLLPGLQSHPTTLVFLAFLDKEPIGIAVCFLGFSTFAARPLINIHDLSVIHEYRGRGVGKRLLAAVEKKAAALNCCKLTLEVLEKNSRARAVYKAAGFAEPVYHNEAELTLFLSKRL